MSGCLSDVLDLGYAELNMRLTKGDDRVFTMAFTDKDTGLAKDLAGYVFTAGIVSPAISFTVTNTVPLTGIITITISGSSTSALVVGATYSWAMSYVVSGKTRTVMKGNVVIV